MIVLILGGTAEARALAAAWTTTGVPVVTSLAGRVARPRLPAGEVRDRRLRRPRGGSRGGCASHDIAAVVDATHPFAERIDRLRAPSAAPRRACRCCACSAPAGRSAPVTTGAGSTTSPRPPPASPALGRRVFLTTGRQGLAAFADTDAWFLVRCVDPPDPPLPARHELLLDRGPYALEDELALIDAHELDLVVTKDSGGDHTAAKLVAARERGLPVVVVRRPPRPGPPETVASHPRGWPRAGPWRRAHAG